MRRNWDKILMETYTELYANSDPPADFGELVANAKMDDRGKKTIDYMAYEIDHSLMLKIMDSIAKKYRFSKHESSSFDFSVLLGCSPKSKNYDQISG